MDENIKQLLSNYRPSNRAIEILRQQWLVIFAGVTGSGKNTIMNELLKTGKYHDTVTSTTRLPRENNGVMEQDGVDYFFVSSQRFEEMIANNELIEYATVYGQYKGIPRFQVRQAFNSGRDVILRIDVQGAASIRKLYPDAVLIFLLPGNEE